MPFNYNISLLLLQVFNFRFSSLALTAFNALALRSSGVNFIADILPALAILYVLLL
ncbi:Uncharacterised protein [Chlamydia trachomatis]|nr:Uncharacterised protein [Chlamydia trachomatis]